MFRLLLELKSDLAAVKSTLESVEDQCKRTNCRMNRAEDRLGAVDIRLASRSDSCPMVTAVSADVIALTDIITTNTATSAANHNWLEGLMPVICGVGLVGLGLVLGHSDLITKFIGK